MPFNTYRATRNIHLGQLRRQMNAGDLLEFDGQVTRVFGQELVLSIMEEIIGNKWLVLCPTTTGTELAVLCHGAQNPTLTPALKAPIVELNKQGERVPYAHKEAGAAHGKRPVSSQQHVWESGAQSWLNNGDGDVCKICGVTKLNPGTLIRADRAKGDGTQQIHYRDAHGNMMTSFEELSCPTYLGDANSAAAVAKDQVRKVRGRVDEHDAALESVDDRLVRLEEDNIFLRERLEQQPTLTAEMVAEALMLIAKQHGSGNRLAEQVRLLIPDMHPLSENDIECVLPVAIKIDSDSG